MRKAINKRQPKGDIYLNSAVDSWLARLALHMNLYRVSVSILFFTI